MILICFINMLVCRSFKIGCFVAVSLCIFTILLSVVSEESYDGCSF